MPGFHKETIGVLEYQKRIPVNAAMHQQFHQIMKELTMLQNVTRPVGFGFVFIIILSVVIVAFAPNISHGQAEATNTLKSYLTNLRDSNTQVYIGLMTPIEENPGWAVPEDLTDTAGNVVGRRVIGEIGEDFVCIDSIGRGFTVTRCIPFTNIAVIRQPAP